MKQVGTFCLFFYQHLVDPRSDPLILDFFFFFLMSESHKYSSQTKQLLQAVLLVDTEAA